MNDPSDSKSKDSDYSPIDDKLNRLKKPKSKRSNLKNQAAFDPDSHQNIMSPHKPYVTLEN